MTEMHSTISAGKLQYHESQTRLQKKSSRLNRWISSTHNSWQHSNNYNSYKKDTRK